MAVPTNYHNGNAAGVRCLTGTACRVEPDGTGDMPTIQAAIDAVAEGDTVVLAPGTYRGPRNRDISFRGKSILAWSDTRGDEAVIDCTGISGEIHCGFEFSNGEDTSSVLERVFVMWAAAWETIAFITAGPVEDVRKLLRIR